MVSPTASKQERRLGDFILREKLGEGGFGAVYRAEQPLLQREAVIKILHQKHQARSESTQRFLREARLASKLDHPFAAHVYAFGAEPDGLLWIAMELVRGTPLSEVLKAQGAMPIERFVPLFDRICDVVHTAHEAGIVHRDLKPANVMVIARAGKLLPKLLDFGIAKMSGDVGETFEGISGEDGDEGGAITQEGQAIGSPVYMAPEQWVDAAKLVDARTDQYALGILAWECLHGPGKVPFRGVDKLALARAHMKKPVPPIREELPPALQAVFARALAKKQIDRYPSVIDLASGFRTASGVGLERETLPRLDDTLRNELGDAPQPIADAVVAFDGARNAHQARDAMWEIVHVVVRYLGALALASRTRVGPGGEADSATVVDGMRALRRADVDDAGWLTLIRALTRPFVDKADAYPIAELVPFLHGGSAPLDRLIALRLAEAGAMTVDVQVLDELNRALPDVAALLRQLGFLADYVLAVPREPGSAERWVGPRRIKRMSMAVIGDPGVAGRPVLLDRDGRPVLSLWPLLQIEPPTPGAAPELFLFDGKGRRGARLVAAPIGFERQDEPVWDWFREKLLVGGEGEEAHGGSERPPYLGLASYRPDDAATFFGRERQAEAFVNRLRVQPLLAVVGPSGAGKSSFLQAGVVPLLGDDWTVITVRPGATPMAALRARIGDADLATLGSPNLLLVVDQFEELFTLCLDPEERAAYAQTLVAAAVSQDVPVRVVLTLRDDFLVRAEHERALRDRLAQGLQLLSTPSSDDLLRIVTEPARVAGYGFDDPELPAQMVAAVADQPGALPLLSFTASKLWELRDRHFKQLTRKAYDALGGVGGALAQHAEQTLAAMPADEQRLVREAFRHLVTAEGTRAVLTRTELGQLLRGGDVVLEKLIGARLLTASEDGKIEVIHEALLSAWPRLADWRREDAEGARLRDQLRAAARQWVERDRPRGLLWRDDALDELRRWRARHGGALTEGEEAFAAASLRDAARGVRIRRGLYAAGVLVLAGVVIGQLVNNRAIAKQRALAEENAVKADASARAAKDSLLSSYEEQARQYWLGGDAPRAAAFLEAARARGRDTPAMRYLASRIIEVIRSEVRRFRHPDLVVAAVPSGAGMITASWDGTVSSWALDGKRPRWSTRGHDGYLLAFAADPETKTVVSGGYDGSVRIYHPATGAVRASLEPGAPVKVVAVSPDGSSIAVGTEAGAVTLWDAATGTRRHEVAAHTGAVSDLRFVGDALWSGGADGKARRWDAATLRPVTTLLAGKAPVQVRVAGNGPVITAAGSDATIWNGERATVLGHAQTILAVGLSGDGALLATGCEDGRVYVWSTANGALLQVLVDHVGAVRAVAFSASGAQLASVGRDGGARIWEPRGGQLLHRYAAHGDGVLGVLWVDEERFVTLGRDRQAKLWNIAERAARIWKPDGTAVRWARFSPDGTRLAIATDTLGIWDPTMARQLTSAVVDTQLFEWDDQGKSLLLPLADGSVTRRDATTLANSWTAKLHEAVATQAVFDRANRRVASAGWDGFVSVLDAESGRVLRRVELGGQLGTIEFSADGTSLLVSAVDGAIHLVDPETGARRRTLQHPIGAASAVFDARGARILSAGSDSTARVWDVATGEVLQSLTGHTNFVQYASFSTGDDYLVTSSDDGTTRVWDARSGRVLEVLLAPGQRLTGHDVTRDARWLVTSTQEGTIALYPFLGGDLGAFAERFRCWGPFGVDQEGTLLPRSPACEL